MLAAIAVSSLLWTRTSALARPTSWLGVRRALPNVWRRTGGPASRQTRPAPLHGPRATARPAGECTPCDLDRSCGSSHGAWLRDRDGPPHARVRQAARAPVRRPDRARLIAEVRFVQLAGLRRVRPATRAVQRPVSSGSSAAGRCGQSPPNLIRLARGKTAIQFHPPDHGIVGPTLQTTF